MANKSLLFFMKIQYLFFLSFISEPPFAIGMLSGHEGVDTHFNIFTHTALVGR